MRLIVLLLCCVILSACGSLSTMQTARTLEPGQHQVSGGVNLVRSRSGYDGALNANVEVRYRLGFRNNWEFGGKFSLLGMALGIKHQLIDWGSFAFSVGAEGYFPHVYRGNWRETNNRDYSSVTLVIPLYFSLDWEIISLYTSPKYLITAGDNFAAASIGFRFGLQFGAFVESTYLYRFRNSRNNIMVGAGIYYRSSAEKTQKSVTPKKISEHKKEEILKGGDLSPDEKNILKRGKFSESSIVVGGIAGSLVGLGIGHALQGRFMERGWIFLLGEVGCIVGGVIWSSNYGSPKSEMDFGALVGIVVGFGAALGFHLWEIIDVWAYPVHHNQKYDQILTRKTAFVPAQSGIKLNFVNLRF